MFPGVLDRILIPGIDSRDNVAISFAEACAYTAFAETYNLTVDLGGMPFDVPASDASEAGIVTRQAEPMDLASVQSFIDVHWPAWQGEVAAAFANAPPTLYLAFDGDTIVGFSAYDANNRGTGWFGPMGVSPEARGTGTGCVLLRRCLADLRAQGLETATIPWVGPVAFYEKCAGARLARTFLRFEKAL